MYVPEHHPLPAQRGLSLIELMVAITVSLLVGLAATGSAMTFNAAQRQGIDPLQCDRPTGWVRPRRAPQGLVRLIVPSLGFLGDSSLVAPTRARRILR